MHIEYIKPGSTAEGNSQVEVLVSEVMRHRAGEFRQTVSGHRLVFFRTLRYRNHISFLVINQPVTLFIDSCITVGEVVTDTFSLFNPLQISRIVRIRHVTGGVIFLPFVYIIREADKLVIIGSSHQCEAITEVFCTDCIHRYIKLETCIPECAHIGINSGKQVGRNGYGVATQQIALFAVEVVQ